MEKNGWEVLPMNSYKKIKSTERFSIILNTATPSVPAISDSRRITTSEKMASKIYSDEVEKPSLSPLSASLKEAACLCSASWPSERVASNPTETSTATALEIKKPKLQPAMPQLKNSSRMALMIRLPTPVAVWTTVENVSSPSFRR